MLAAVQINYQTIELFKIYPELVELVARSLSGLIGLIVGSQTKLAKITYQNALKLLVIMD